MFAYRFLILTFILLFLPVKSYAGNNVSCSNDLQVISMWKYTSEIDVLFIGEPYEPILLEDNNGEELLVGMKVKVLNNFKGLPSDTENIDLFTWYAPPSSFSANAKLFRAKYDSKQGKYFRSGLPVCKYKRNFSDEELIGYLKSNDFLMRLRLHFYMPYILLFSALALITFIVIMKRLLSAYSENSND